MLFVSRLAFRPDRHVNFIDVNADVNTMVFKNLTDVAMYLVGLNVMKVRWDESNPSHDG